ncbi:hypothetical protein ACODM8_14375 [Vibrio ostreicida]|uniref:hypothetical protein n=1 Tax=Vibrio ostreicida TaxID=526588 RepID=UPI003B5ACB6C
MDIEDLDVPSITDDEAAFLQALESDAVSDTVESEDLALKGATGTALMLLNMAEGVTKNLLHSDFAWNDKEKEAAAEQIAPALAKNGGELPEWLQPYKEELIALFAVGSLAFGGYMQVKELRKLEEAQQNQPPSARASSANLEESFVAT